MIIAKKQISKEINKDIETIKYHKFTLKDINEKRIRDFYDCKLIDNDSEENFFEYGLSVGFNDDVLCINAEKFIKGLREWIEVETYNIDEDKSVFIQDAEEIIKDLTKYIEYDLTFYTNEKEAKIYENI